MQTTAYPRPYLGWRDFAELFDCGRSKALLLMHEVGVVHIGHAVFVRASDLDAYLEEHGSIDITWPKATTQRKGASHAR
ncbi:MAG: hypothetical protein IJI68_11525 [Eggerthellaceae bacterium]|nr:hypothetical protein [Eggerthellaceae bacterium]